MPKINPLVSLFLAIATLNAGMFMWLRADIARVETGLHADIAEVRATQSEHGERLARIEAVVETLAAAQVEHSARLARVEAGLSVTNERMARIEGTVAGALGRPFPERMAQAPGAGDGAGG